MKYLVLLLAFSGLFSGCSTIQTAPQRGGDKMETASMLPVPAGRGSHEDSGLVVAYDFITADGSKLTDDGTCRLRLIDSSSRRSYFMNLDRTKTVAFVSLPAGHYETGRLGCGIARVWDVGNIFQGGLQVASGSASYAGKIDFVFKGDKLSHVEKATRAGNAESFNQAVTLVPSGLRVVSAFNLQVLTPEMASSGIGASGFDLEAQGIPTGAVLNGLLGQLRQCEPKSKDPLKFGRLDYTAVYEKGRFSQFKDKKDVNAFNDGFKDCVSETLSSFKPPQTGAVEIHVIY